MSILGKDDRMFENRALGQAACDGVVIEAYLSFEKLRTLNSGDTQLESSVYRRTTRP